MLEAGGLELGGDRLPRSTPWLPSSPRFPGVAVARLPARREVDDRDASARLQRAQDAAVHRRRIAEVVIHVAHEDGVAAGIRKIGRVSCPSMTVDVGGALFRRLVADRCTRSAPSSLLITRPLGPTCLAIATVSSPPPAPISAATLPGRELQLADERGRVGGVVLRRRRTPTPASTASDTPTTSRFDMVIIDEKRREMV